MVASASKSGTSAGAAPRPTPRPSKIRSVAHRFASACARDLNDIFVVGVRFDDDEPGMGDSLVVRLRPGRVEAVAAISGIARTIGFCGNDVVVLDDGNALRNVNREVVLDSVTDLYDDGKRLLALRGDDVVDVATRATVARAPGAVSLRGGVVRTTRGVTDLDGNALVSGVVDIACQSGKSLAYVRGRTLTIDGTTLALPWNAHSLARVFNKWFIGSHQGGLAVVDDGKVVPLRPSLRAHQLTLVGPPQKTGLLIVSDLFVALSDDGVDFVSRDLAPFVRLAEKSVS